MIIERQELKDILLLKPEVYKDDRGYFFESFKQNLFNDLEINYQEIFNKNHRIGAILFVGMLFDLNI